MVHDDKARPVSGEIMSAAVFHNGAARPHGTQYACDAQFETLPRAEKTISARADMMAASPACAIDGSAAGMGFLTQDVSSAKAATRRGGLLFWSAGLTFVALAFWISGGHAVLMNIEALSPAQSSPALRIAAVESRITAIEGQKILFVDGHAENHGTLAQALPAIEIAVTDNDGGVARYHLGSREPQLAPGNRYVFSSRLQAPDAGVKTVTVAFAEEGR